MVANNSLFRVPGGELAIPRAVQDLVSCADPNRTAGVRCHARYGFECIGKGWAPFSVVPANYRSVLRDAPKQTVFVLAHRFYSDQGSSVQHAFQLHTAASDSIQAAPGRSHPDAVVPVFNETPNIGIRGFNFFKTGFRIAIQSRGVGADPDRAFVVFDQDSADCTRRICGEKPKILCSLFRIVFEKLLPRHDPNSTRAAACDTDVALECLQSFKATIAEDGEIMSLAQPNITGRIGGE